MSRAVRLGGALPELLYCRARNDFAISGRGKDSFYLRKTINNFRKIDNKSVKTT